jgi:hypothetical protein
MSLQSLDEISELLKAHLAGEAQAGFPKLMRTPSSGTIAFLDYFGTLTAADRDSLLDVRAQVDARTR